MIPNPYEKYDLIFPFLFQSTVDNFTESDMSGIPTLLDLMSVGDTDFSSPATTVSFLFDNSPPTFVYT